MFQVISSKTLKINNTIAKKWVIVKQILCVPYTEREGQGYSYLRQAGERARKQKELIKEIPYLAQRDKVRNSLQFNKKKKVIVVFTVKLTSLPVGIFCRTK